MKLEVLFAAGLLVAVLVGGILIFNTINSSIINESLNDFMDIFPVAVLLMVMIIPLMAILSISRMYSDNDLELEEDTEEDITPMEQIKKARKTAAEILAERYARGELSDEEYTDKMARL